MPRYVGSSVRRIEDPRLIQGRGTYVDDISLPGMLYAKILRSPYAHARIKKIDYSQASQLEGVIDVITAKEASALSKPWHNHLPGTDEKVDLFGSEKVFFVAQEVAAVAAVRPEIAEDALELIEVEYEPLPVVIDPEDALRPDAPIIRTDLKEIKGNIGFHYTLRAGDIDKAFREADFIFKERFTTNRPHVAPLETAGCLANYDIGSKHLTVWATSQNPFHTRAALAESLQLDESMVRVIAPDIGGGFGPKSDMYAHYVIASVLSIRTGKPVKIILDRREDMLTEGHRNGSVRYTEVAVQKDGRILGWKEKVIWDSGARHGFASSNLVKACLTLAGPYKIENVLINADCVYTNKSQASANRGFGHPQTVYARERMIDIIAHKLSLDPLEIRLRNVIKPEEVPYRSSTGPVFDSPHFVKCLRKATEAVKLEKLQKEGTKRVGFGIALLQKNTSGYHMFNRGDYESARVYMDPGGFVTVFASSTPQGQGHETILSQVCAEELGIPMNRVRVIHGDTEKVPHGMGTWGSRTAVITTGAVHLATRKLRNKINAIAAHALGVPIEGLEFENEKIRSGSSGEELTINEVARIAYTDPSKIPEGLDPTLSAEATFDPPGKEPFDKDGCSQVASTYDIGAHAAVVEIDPQTGEIKIVDYAAAHDCGVLINPMIVDGQIQGGVTHGIGMALFEDLLWDREGQPLNPSFMEFFVPTAMEIPRVEKIFHFESRNPNTPGGYRGVGESGVVVAPAAIANAVSDALGFDFTDLPITPEKVFWALEKQRSSDTDGRI